jgi:two-component system chemotaxis response regulator CheB
LRGIVRGLPKDFGATVFVVLHVAPESPSILHRLLDNVSVLPVRQAEDGQAFRAGQIWVAPPDRHLVLGGRTHAGCRNGPRENRHRPSIDVLFRSAALAFGPARHRRDPDRDARRRRGRPVVREGARRCRARAGSARRVRTPSCRTSALDMVEADDVLPLQEVAPRLVQLAREPVAHAGPAADRRLELEVNMASRNTSTMEQLDAIGERSSLTCPECGGALWELHEAGPRFRCHVGHAYSMRSIMAAQVERVEAALWASLRSLEESEALARRLRHGATGRGHRTFAQQCLKRAEEDQAHADVLRYRAEPAADPARRRRGRGYRDGRHA